MPRPLLSPTYRAYLCLLACGPLMAGNLVAGKWGIEWLPPVTLACLRWLLALLILLPIYGPGMKPFLAPLRRRWLTVAAMGLTGMSICGAWPYIAMQSTTAVNTSFIYATAPLAMVLLAWAMKGEKPHLAQGLGLVLAFTGILTLMSRGSWANILGLQFHPGDLWVLGAVASWATYSYLQRHTPVPVPAMPLLVASIGAGVLLMLPFSLYELAVASTIPSQAAKLTAWQGWAAAVFLAVFPSIMSYQCYNYGIRTVGTAKAALFLYIVPLWSAGLALSLLNEGLQWFHYAAIGLIMPGVMLGSRKRKPTPEPAH